LQRTIKMNSSKSGTIISDFKVTSINDLGFWALVEDKEYFIPFANYPEFKEASINQIFQMEFTPPSQLHWTLLDIDIELQALTFPDFFPLQFKP